MAGAMAVVQVVQVVIHPRAVMGHQTATYMLDRTRMLDSDPHARQRPACSTSTRWVRCNLNALVQFRVNDALLA
eukprot:SAG11_NODE_4606_length_1838_cov_1.256469_1_plen_74_part_00